MIGQAFIVPPTTEADQIKTQSDTIKRQWVRIAKDAATIDRQAARCEAQQRIIDRQRARITQLEQQLTPEALAERYFDGQG